MSNAQAILAVLTAAVLLSGVSLVVNPDRQAPTGPTHTPTPPAAAATHETLPSAPTTAGTDTTPTPSSAALTTTTPTSTTTPPRPTTTTPTVHIDRNVETTAVPDTPRTGWYTHATQRAQDAAAYGQSLGLRVAVAIADTRSGSIATAGDRGEFATASVVKPLIAAKLLAQGRNSLNLSDIHQMIAASNDNIASRLWVKAGGPNIEPWVEQYYHIPGLGSPNSKPGFWGNTHITAVGMAQFYIDILHDPLVGPTLIDAMRDITPTAADGTPQYFGIPTAAKGRYAVKQGWAAYSADTPGNYVLNTTGYVNNTRNVVVILTEGNHNHPDGTPASLNHEQARTVTEMARIALGTDTAN